MKIPEYINRIIHDKASKYGVSPLLIKAIIAKESGFDPNAISPTGDLGIMQINPKAHPDFDVNKWYDPEYNIDYGVRFLKELINRYGKHGIEAIISAYNAGHPTYRNYWSYVVPVLKNLLRFILPF